jgi:hypothetical protein
MKTILKTITISTILFLAMAAHATGTIVKVNFETIDQGVWSHYKINDKQHIIEIYNQNDWQAFWNQHTESITPAPKLPAVDFQKYFILIAIDEIRPSGGYAIEIKEITIDTAAENKPFAITLQAKQPGSASGNLSALTRPYHIVMVKK